jgi:hypothetical protein
MRLHLPAFAQNRSTTHQRYEAKYLLSPVAREMVREYLLGYTRPDAHTATYAVTSVYYDSPTWHTFRSSLHGEKNRFKLRVRTYGDPFAPGAYAEIKQRIDRIIVKKRVALTPSAVELTQRPVMDWAPFLQNPDDERAAGTYESFVHLAHRISAVPVMGVRYIRDAFESAVEEPVRVTIDSALTYLPVDGLIDGSAWRPAHTVPDVLEVKFTDAFPFWIRQMIERYELTRVSLAKYVSCVQAFADDGGLRGMAPAEEMVTWTP